MGNWSPEGAAGVATGAGVSVAVGAMHYMANRCQCCGEQAQESKAGRIGGRVVQQRCLARRKRRPLSRPPGVAAAVSACINLGLLL